MNKNQRNGFTLMELMVTLALAGILLAIAVPNMGVFIKNNRLTSVANDLLHSLQLARTEAIKRQSAPNSSGRITPKWVDVCSVPDSDAATGSSSLTCNSTAAFSNWIVFVDDNRNGQFDSGTETLLERGKANSNVTAKSDNGGIVCYKPDGFANVDCNGKTPTQNVVYCDSRGNQAVGTDSTARAVLVSTTGRARVTRTLSDVTATLTAMSVTCP